MPAAQRPNTSVLQRVFILVIKLLPPNSYVLSRVRNNYKPYFVYSPALICYQLSMTDERIIINKYGRTWTIPKGMKGTPIQDKWPNTKIPKNLKDALIYNIDGQEIIAHQLDE